MKKIQIFLFSFIFLGCILFALSFTPPKNISATSYAISDTLTEAQKRLPENALKGLNVAYGLQVQLMATEPFVKNPTNIDVDQRGRIWVTEAYNYRPNNTGNPTNPKGDRIMILEDLNNDAIIDTAKVFYQGPEINAPLGIAVLGKRVIVCQSPYVWNFYDDNGDDKADRKEIMFQGIGGEQHDHAIHAFTFGADGKLYFNFGNAGIELKDKNNKAVLDQDGDEIGPKKYKQGLVFRCDPDGSHVECLGQNFRNPYEVAVDSYGTMWQSDNDDDGNKGVRINYVMPYGNFGYTDEVTGAGWSSNRTNIEDSIPFRHWHLNDPGVVPNMLQTGAGSPTGILVYEGNLLPEAFQHQLIHSDAGPNVVRSYSIIDQGAGYSSNIINILSGEKDKWFRPADVCVAPDGSLIVADWYDPGVGGHQAGDQTRGRIYRVAPIESKFYTTPELDLSNPPKAVIALQSPNLDVRYLAYDALQLFGHAAISPLEKLWKSDADPAMRARAFWALIKMQGANHQKYLNQATKDKNPNIRILSLRGSFQLSKNLINTIDALKNDPDPKVKREAAIMLHHNKDPQAATLWAELASQYDGIDRWYLEALGIGADEQWDSYLTSYIEKVKNPIQDEAGRNIVWRARTNLVLPYLSIMALDEKIPLRLRLKYFRAFDFIEGTEKEKTLISMLGKSNLDDIQLNKLILSSLNPSAVANSLLAKNTLNKVLEQTYGTKEYLELVAKYDVNTEMNRVLEMAIDKNSNDLGRTAARMIINSNATNQFWKVFNNGEVDRSTKLLNAISKVNSVGSVDIIQKVIINENIKNEIRKFAASNIGKSGEGEKRVLSILKQGIVPKALIADVVASVSGSRRVSVINEAKSYLNNTNEQPIAVAIMPTYAEIIAIKSNASKGHAVYMSNCAVCHKINNEGYDLGPALSEIGSKYGKDGMFKSIIYPSDGISFGYETTSIKLNDGSEITGIVSSKTKLEIEVKMPGGIVQKIKATNIKSMEQLKTSYMPADLYSQMTTQELSDLLGYLESLKKK
jgi:putative membrane-bound dehydrogenase-like protein